MPKREDIKSILVIGSGRIDIAQDRLSGWTFGDATGGKEPGGTMAAATAKEVE